MTDNDLGKALEDPQLHALILKSYKGAYSLGVTRVDGVSTILLRVQGEAVPSDIPQEVTIAHESVKIVVETGFRTPRALAN